MTASSDQRRFKGAGIRRGLRAPDVASVASVEPWLALESLAGLVEAFDPARLFVGSDWTGVVAGTTISQSTGSQQPTEEAGPWPSGSAALRFTQAASQRLFTLIANAVSDQIDTEDFAVYTLFSAATSAAQTIPIEVANDTRANRLVHVLQIADTLTVTFATSIGGVNQVNAPGSFVDGEGSWIRASCDGSDNTAQIRGGATATTLNTAHDWTTNRLSVGGSVVPDSYFNGHIGAILVLQESAADHAAVQAALDALAGLT